MSIKKDRYSGTLVIQNIKHYLIYSGVDEKDGVFSRLTYTDHNIIFHWNLKKHFPPLCNAVAAQFGF